MKYSYYHNKNSKQCRQVSVSELLDLIGTEEMKERCAKISAAVLAGDEKEANILKNELPAIVVSELYKSGAPRKKGTGDPSGLFMIDYDYCKSPEELNELKGKVTDLALQHPVLKELIVAAHVSPRLHGGADGLMVATMWRSVRLSLPIWLSCPAMILAARMLQDARSLYIRVCSLYRTGEQWRETKIMQNYKKN